jgi:plastocyanin
MVSFNSATLSVTLLAVVYIPSATAAPTATSNIDIAVATMPSGSTHTVVAGIGGLHFDPENVVAEIGDIVEFHFLAANHSVAQSSFDKPCVPLTNPAGADITFFSGFMPTLTGSQNPNMFTIKVTDENPGTTVPRRTATTARWA